MLSMTPMGFGSNPSLAKVTLLEEQTKIPKVNRLCEKFNYINEYIYMLEDLYQYCTPESDYVLL